MTGFFNGLRNKEVRHRRTSLFLKRGANLSSLLENRVRFPAYAKASADKNSACQAVAQRA